MEEILEISLLNVEADDMVGIQISNSVNSVDKAIGVSFRRKDQGNQWVIYNITPTLFESTSLIRLWFQLVSVGP
jgi:hypothetical protein